MSALAQNAESQELNDALEKLGRERMLANQANWKLASGDTVQLNRGGRECDAMLWCTKGAAQS